MLLLQYYLYFLDLAILDLIPPSQDPIATAMMCIISMVLILHRIVFIIVEGCPMGPKRLRLQGLHG